MNERDNQVIEATDFSRPEPVKPEPFFSPSPLKISLLLFFLVLATVALFMFNARAVKFTFDPPEANLAISGTIPAYPLGGRFLMLQDDYELKIAAEGYYDLETALTLTGEPDQDYHYSLERLPGIVKVSAHYNDSEILDAEILIDQELLGVTPLEIDEVKAGSRDLYINHPRFLPAQEVIEVIGRREKQAVSVQLDPAWANIEISSLPQGAEILVDDKLAGTTPASIELIQGDRTIKVRKPGYKVFESFLEVVAQQDMTLERVLLEKADGKLNIDSLPAGANITISGRYYGQTPLAVALAPGENYELIATRAGYQTQKRKLSVDPNEDLSLNLTLKPVTGLVKLMVAPVGATLFVDDKAQGNPNQTLELTARPHRIRIELPGFASYDAEVIPQPGFPQQLNIQLLTEEAARVSAIPQELTTSLGDTLRFIVPENLTMGAGRREPGRRSNEIEKTVVLTRPFYMGTHEISNASFKAFDPGHDSGLMGRALLSEDDRPVVNVSWQKAVEYCNWLSEKDGLPVAYVQRNGKWILAQPLSTGYRLPTEAEWAWAARYASGPPTRFPWGESMPPPAGTGNFADESAANMVAYSIRGYNDNFRGPAPSGTFSANELGIFDLAGNVSEWINDYYSVELHRETLTDPLGPERGEYYVIRGSNYTHGRFSELRWTFRDYGADPRPDVGFRIARFAE